MKAVHFLPIILSVALLGVAQEITFIDTPGIFPGPQVYKDTHSGTLLYIESDGRHVAGISADGKLLWNRDPFKDAHLKLYRTDKPQIVHIGEATAWGENPPSQFRSHEFVVITFNSSQFGALNISNGDFKFLGQN